MLISLAPQHIQSDSMFLRIQLAVISSLLPEEFCMGVGWQRAWSWREREIERERGRETSVGGWCVSVSLRVMGVYESRCFPIFNVQPPRPPFPLKRAGFFQLLHAPPSPLRMFNQPVWLPCQPQRKI